MTLQPAAPFTNYLEYLPFLLSLMSELDSAPPAQVKEAFGKKYGTFIPVKDKAIMDSGKERWSYNLEWARFDMTQLGLMQSPARGIWAISEDGRIWLQHHLDTDYALRSMRTMMHERKRGERGPIEIKEHFEFTWRGKGSYQADAPSLIASATDILRNGNPPEAFRFKDWYATVDGKQVSVKWLFHLLTKAGYDEFVTYQAVAIVRKLGIPVNTLHQKDSRRARTEPESEPWLTGKTSTDFQALQTLLLEKSAILEQTKISYEKNSLAVVFPNLPASHYEFRFTRNEVEIGFNLQSIIPRVNHERIETLKPIAPQWSQALGQEVKAEKWGKRWARVYVSTDRFSSLAQRDYQQMEQSANLFTQSIGSAGKNHPDWDYDKITAEAFATLIIRFIEVTYPDLVTNIFRQRHTKTANNANAAYGDNPQAHKQLDQKITEIHGFLSGRLMRTPKDEELCDWIQLCYLFDLSREGYQLFAFVQPQVLNNEWLYRRTKKFADLCRLKTTNKG